MKKNNHNYVQKIPYEFIESYIDERTGIRYYKTPEGESLPSVTSILNVVYNEKNEELQNWKKRIGEKKAKEISDESKIIGTLVHKNIENYVKSGNFIEGNNFVRKLARNMSKILVERFFYNIDEIWGIEIPLWFPGLYAGTSDLIFLKKNHLYIGDIKTTKNKKEDNQIINYKLQTIAYALAHNKIYGTNIKRTCIFMVSRNMDIQFWEIDEEEYSELYDKWIEILCEYYEKK
ncbi:MAG: hypothetical protein QXF12_02690 [Candidatus Aenigmatarchaeota archaeon]